MKERNMKKSPIKNMAYWKAKNAASPAKMFGVTPGRSAKDMMGIMDLSNNEEEVGGGGKDIISKKIDKKVDQKVEEVVNQKTGEGLV